MVLRGVIWIAKQIQKQAERELYDEDGIRGQLMELELRLDLGEITEEEYEAAEEELLARLKAAREYNASRET